MTLPEKFIEQINKAIDEYDNGTLTRTALSKTVRQAIEQSATEAYEAGHAEGWDEGFTDAEENPDDDEIELDIDLNNIDDTDEGDDQ